MNTLECGFTAEQKRQALEQVLQGATFARADQLKRFLRYVCEMEIAGRAQEIKEYSIATEALGRSAAYSPGDGSSVRSRAHALRQKLQEFYELENPDAEIRIELHKGSYIPVFVERAERADAPAERVVTPANTRGMGFAFGAGAAAATLLCSAAALLFLVPRTASPIEPELKEAWGPLLQPGASVMLCIGSPPALLMKSFKDGAAPGTGFMPAPPNVASWYSDLHMQDGGGQLYMNTTLNALLTGDALAAIRAIRLLSRSGASAQVLPEAGLRPLALRGRNVLLIGSPNYSPYAARVLRSMPFSVRYDTAHREEVIADGPPEEPRTQVFRPKHDETGQTTQVYGLLTVLPSQVGGEGHEQTVIFSGISSAGPQGAMEFFASADGLRDFRERLRREGHAKLPSTYQVVVRCGVDRLLALNWAYEAHRVISTPPAFD